MTSTQSTSALVRYAGWALRQVAERDDELARSGAGQRGGVDELHGVSWLSQRRSAGSSPSWRVIADSRPGPMSLRRSLTTVLRFRGEERERRAVPVGVGRRRLLLGRGFRRGLGRRRLRGPVVRCGFGVRRVVGEQTALKRGTSDHEGASDLAESAESTSVRAKSLPLNRSGSPVASAKA